MLSKAGINSSEMIKQPQFFPFEKVNSTILKPALGSQLEEFKLLVVFLDLLEPLEKLHFLPEEGATVVGVFTSTSLPTLVEVWGMVETVPFTSFNTTDFPL